MRVLLAALAAVVITSSCAATQVTPTSQPTPNINRSRLDLAYSTIASADLHKASSRTLLTAALTAVRLQATSTGGTVEPATPAFSDVSDAVPDDFKVFAHAVEGIALKNPQLSADLISDSAIEAMVKATPDCYTNYWRALLDVEPAVGLQSRLLPGNVGYLTWRAFVRGVSYDIVVEVRKALDALVAQGARAWLFDLRDSGAGGHGGPAASVEMADWFLNGEPKYLRLYRVGAPATTSARSERRLPAAYQLPIAIILDHRSVDSAETFAMPLRENARATIVGATSFGCLGVLQRTLLPGGGAVDVAVEEFIGAISGTHYDNVGITPDIASADATALDDAAKFLQSKVRP